MSLKETCYVSINLISLCSMDDFKAFLFLYLFIYLLTPQLGKLH